MNTLNKAGVFVFPADLVDGLADDDLVIILIEPVIIPERFQGIFKPVLEIRIPVLPEKEQQMAAAHLVEQGAPEKGDRECPDGSADGIRYLVALA